MGRIPTVVFDFDGVIHSYTSGWKGATCIPDPPVDGIKEAIASIRDAGYKVVVVSTRCRTEDGLIAVENYLDDNNIDHDEVLAEKPPAVCYIDDRAIRFDGHADILLDQIKNFHSWTEGMARNDKPVENLRRCKAIRYYKGETYIVSGRFHRWAEEYEEFETGPGNFTVALIEQDDGTVVSCAPESVVFLDREE